MSKTDPRDNDYHMKATDVASAIGGGVDQKGVMQIQRRAITKLRRAYLGERISLDDALAGARLRAWNGGRRR